MGTLADLPCSSSPTLTTTAALRLPRRLCGCAHIRKPVDPPKLVASFAWSLPSLYYCRRSGIPLRLSFRRSATVVLQAYRYGCCSGVSLQLSVRRTATVVATVFLRNRGVVSLVAFWRRLVASIFSAHIEYVFRLFLTFHTLLLNFRGT